jgi:hypothetical protein
LTLFYCVVVGRGDCLSGTRRSFAFAFVFGVGLSVCARLMST